MRAWPVVAFDIFSVHRLSDTQQPVVLSVVDKVRKAGRQFTDFGDRFRLADVETVSAGRKLDAVDPLVLEVGKVDVPDRFARVCMGHHAVVAAAVLVGAVADVPGFGNEVHTPCGVGVGTEDQGVASTLAGAALEPEEMARSDSHFTQSYAGGAHVARGEGRKPGSIGGDFRHGPSLCACGACGCVHCRLRSIAQPEVSPV